ncbi:MAG: PCMD domain-containing protein [Odoribacteraceae bacterium]|jgi:hypothetical protein|nr:PCMD domain-containing protein [Odoribacteraceae bacterium]
MKNGWVYVSLALLACACHRVNDLSDEAFVEHFTVTSLQPEDARLGEVFIEPGKIRVELLPREGLFPVTFRVTAKVSPTTDDVLNFPGEFRFETSNAVETFHLIAASGVPHAYEVSLKPLDTGADILDVTLPSGENATVAVDPWQGTVSISADHPHFPYTITPTITLSPGATASSRDTSITFTHVDEVKYLTVSAGDESTTRSWKFSIEGAVQLPNADFEQWTGTGTSININPTPGKVWGTANNYIIQGTTPVEHAGGMAAEMTTKIQTVPLLGHKLIAAGTLYTGYFTLGFNFENPRSMTFFGVPHTRAIASVAFDVQYVAGPQMQQSVKSGTKYVVEAIPGVDQGEAWVEVLHWNGSGKLEYHGTPVAGLTVLGRGSVLLDGADESLRTWKNIVMPVTYTDETLAPTHLVIVFSSSREGDRFKGADGSKLTVDNVILLY